MEIMHFIRRADVEDMSRILNDCADAATRIVSHSDNPLTEPADQALKVIREHLHPSVEAFEDAARKVEPPSAAPLQFLDYGARAENALLLWKKVEDRTKALLEQAEQIDQAGSDMLVQDGYSEEVREERESVDRFMRAVSEWWEWVQSNPSSDAEYDYDEYERWWYIRNG